MSPGGGSRGKSVGPKLAVGTSPAPSRDQRFKKILKPHPGSLGSWPWSWPPRRVAKNTLVVGQGLSCRKLLSRGGLGRADGHVAPGRPPGRKGQPARVLTDLSSCQSSLRAQVQTKCQLQLLCLGGFRAVQPTPPPGHRPNGRSVLGRLATEQHDGKRPRSFTSGPALSPGQLRFEPLRVARRAQRNLDVSIVLFLLASEERQT